MNNITYQLGKSRYINGMCVTEYLNGKPNNFWSLDDLNSLQYCNVESFRNTRDWLIRNHPELLI
jgi:hypothetical protein